MVRDAYSTYHEFPVRENDKCGRGCFVVIGRHIEARGLDTCLRRYDMFGVWRASREGWKKEV